MSDIYSKTSLTVLSSPKTSTLRRLYQRSSARQIISRSATTVFLPTPNEYKDEVDYKTAIGRWNDFVMLGSKIDNADNRLDYVIAGEVLTELFTEWKERSMISTGDYPPVHPG